MKLFELSQLVLSILLIVLVLGMIIAAFIKGSILLFKLGMIVVLIGCIFLAKQSYKELKHISH